MYVNNTRGVVFLSLSYLSTSPRAPYDLARFRFRLRSVQFLFPRRFQTTRLEIGFSKNEFGEYKVYFPRTTVQFRSVFMRLKNVFRVIFLLFFFFFIKRIFVSCLRRPSTQSEPYSTYTGQFHSRTLVFCIYRTCLVRRNDRNTRRRVFNNERALATKLTHKIVVQRQRRTRFTNNIVNIQQLPTNTLSPFEDRLTESARTIFVDIGRPDDKQWIRARRTDQIVFNNLIFPKTNATRYTTIIRMIQIFFLWKRSF